MTEVQNQSTEATSNADGGQEQAAPATEPTATEGTPAPEAGEQQAPSEGESILSQGEEKAPEEPDPSRGAPESYQFSDPDGLPEGAGLDQEVLSTFGDVARELDLSQDAAQNVIDKVMPKLFERAQAQEQATVEQWQKQVESDPEIGGESLKPGLAAAKTAIEKLGTPELRTLLQGPIGNHPELVRFMVRVGRQFSEDMTGQPENVSKEVPVEQLNLNDDAALARKFYGRKS